MFEQSLYEQPFQTPPSDDEKLFENYEIRSWDIGSRIYKIIGISAVANLLALLVVAQGSLLTMKGCDSPLVGRVCSVLDTVYVGSMLFGTDREYIDAAYDKTKIEDLEVTFIDVSNIDPRLNYPESFVDATTGQPVPMLPRFAVQDPMLALNNGMSDIDVNSLPNQFPMPPSTGGSLLDTPQVLPPSNPNVISGNLPDFNSGSSPSYTPPKPRRTPRPKNPGNLPDLDDNDVAEAKPSPSPTPVVAPTQMSDEDIKNVPINKRPLVEFADVVAEKWESKEVDLNQPFTVVLNGVLAADGSLDPKASKFDVAKQKGDEKMINVGKAALEALGKSGYLTYLKNLNVDKFNATLVQDDNQITVVITSAQKTPEAAKTVASGLGVAISVGKTITEDPSDERTLLNGAKVTADGKTFTLNFAIPKPVAQEMINRKLKEAATKRAAQPKPSGTNPARTDDTSAALK